MLNHLQIDAELIVSVNQIPFLLVAEDNYVVVNFKDYNAMDQLLKLGSAMAPAEPKTQKPSGGPLKKLNEINAKVQELGLMVEIRVGSKTYVIFGGNSASIKAAAIFGKIGSFFGK